MTTDPSTDVLAKLYSSGAYIPLAIVIVFLLVTAASRRIAWLQVPNRAHYVSAVIAGLAILVGPATQGTTPNKSMLITALGAVIALLLPGSPLTLAATPTTNLPTATVVVDGKPPQSGRARLGVLLAIASIGFGLWLAACGGGLTSNEKVLMATTATFSASEATFVAWDGKHQLDIVANCDPNAGKPACDAQLADYRAKREKITTAIVDGGKAIDAAWLAITDKTVATAVAAGIAIQQALAALGVK